MDFGAGELGAEMGDCLLAVTLRLCRDGASAHNDEIGGGRGRLFDCLIVRLFDCLGGGVLYRHDLPACGGILSFHIKRLRPVQPATECHEPHFHLVNRLYHMPHPHCITVACVMTGGWLHVAPSSRENCPAP